MSPGYALKETAAWMRTEKHGNMQLVKMSVSSPVVLVVVLAYLAVEMEGQGTNLTERNKKALSVFTVVKVTYIWS